MDGNFNGLLQWSPPSKSRLESPVSFLSLWSMPFGELVVRDGLLERLRNKSQINCLVVVSEESLARQTLSISAKPVY